ncbi:P-loop containing nucleoside triphosphate hydrolase protein [Suillus clintonianus]|uniref:P-loop containing nucleoside triphosphate hydrolase protein n=1 Tax=Suillus clintonianus TaxID=1904413 RepID=UPI001B868CF3|nr:P-loop containing nucleoside triphosphate hydrolase protein [Suillus clintonianus]KAG2157256.1 P-loop containing nucleoside triphosphate hydrolase protein [Suillus clintonianus]
MVPTSLDTMSPSSGRATSASHVSDQSAAHCSYLGTEEASHRTDTCNIVIIGDSGAGKSSLVNLITRTQTARTSDDTMGCTTETTVYEHDFVTQDKILKLQLFDTPGLRADSLGMRPATRAVKNLIRTLMRNATIHILMYCVRRTRSVRALQRNYRFLDSQVNGRAPIVLVVTGLEERSPEMEEWWAAEEESLSDLGMDFDGHACITALTIDECDTVELRQRRKQSYRAVRDLIKQHCPQNMGVPRLTTLPSARKTKNIVLFGEAGVGKSSVINLMAGEEVARTSLGMRRCTLQWQDYAIDFDGESYKVFDTIGIEDSGLDMKEYLMAVANAYRFIKMLDAEGGVDLLLFCIRAGRINAALQNNYRFFHEFLCEKKVPIVLVITGLEREHRMEDWWERECRSFQRRGIHVAGYACITAAEGLEGTQRARYEESRVKIRHLVRRFTADRQQQVWIGGDNLIVSLVRALKNSLVMNPRIRRINLIGQLANHCDMSLGTARQLADMIEQG